MPLAYYLDTGALLPLYIKRATGHTWIASVCKPSSQNMLILAEVTAAELVAALNQLVRGGTLRKKRCNDALALYWDQVDHGQFVMALRFLRLCDAQPIYAMFMLSEDMTPSNWRALWLHRTSRTPA